VIRALAGGGFRIYFLFVTSDSTGTLYLIPTALGPAGDAGCVDERVREIVRSLDGLVAESRKGALLFLRTAGSMDRSGTMPIRLLNEHSRPADLEDLIEPVAQGGPWGLVSDTGCPAVADPGAGLVRLAHQKGIRVRPLAGPSAVLLALMASGLNGQRFVFHGYLSRIAQDRKKQIKEMAADCKRNDRTHLWIETPYRNLAVFDDLIRHVEPSLHLCLAVDLTLPTEDIRTRTVGGWRAASKPDLKDRPAVFLLGRPAMI